MINKKGISFLGTVITLSVAIVVVGIMTWQMWPEQKTKDSSLVSSTSSKELLVSSIPSKEIKKKALELCDKTGNQNSDSCKAMVDAISTNQPQICEKLCEESNDPDTCYYLSAIFTKSPELCEKLDSSQDYGEGRNNCYVTIAEGTNNLKLCEKVVTPGLCYRSMAIYTGNPKLCERCSEQGFCYYNVAVKIKDIKLCEKGFWPNRCRAIISQKPELCEEDEENPKECYLELALATNSPKLCEETDRPKECYLELALLTRNEELCEKSDNPSQCYFGLAIRTKNSEFCKKIEEPESCYFWVAQFLVGKSDWMFEDR